MNASTEEQPISSLDGLKWGVVALLLAAAIGGNYYYGQESVLLRAIGVVVAVGVAGLVAMQTLKGRNAVAFAKEESASITKVPLSVATLNFIFTFILQKRFGDTYQLCF